MNRDPRVDPRPGDVIVGRHGGWRIVVVRVETDDRTPGGSYVVYDQGAARSLDGWRKVHARDHCVPAKETS